MMPQLQNDQHSKPKACLVFRPAIRGDCSGRTGAIASALQWQLAQEAGWPTAQRSPAPAVAITIVAMAVVTIAAVAAAHADR